MLCVISSVAILATFVRFLCGCFFLVVFFSLILILIFHPCPFVQGFGGGRPVNIGRQ